MTTNGVPRKGLWLAIGAAGAVVALGLVWSRFYLHNVCDDSLISLHYARHVAEGEGFVFNPGERVEGYTNFLWVALTALLYPLGDGTGEGFVRLAATFSILLSGVGILLLYLVASRAWNRGLLTCLLAVGLCAVDNDYTVWALHAMEIHLLVVTMLASMLCWWAGSGRASALGAGLFLALSVMTRPDAALWPAVLFFSELAVLIRGGDRAGWARFVVAFGSAALVYGAYFVWRFDYFGYLLPNTYYLKAEGLGTGGVERGLDYVHGFLRTRAYVPLLGLGAVFTLDDRIMRALLAWALLHVAYVVYVGGDFYAGHRFLVVLVPVAALLVAGVFERTLLRRPDARAVRLAPVAAAGMIGLVAVSGWLQGPGSNDILPYGEVIDLRRRAAKWLGRHAPEGATIAAEFLGESGYYARLRVYDIYGIIEPEVSHRPVENFGRGSPGHEKSATVDDVLIRRPTFIRHRDWTRDFYRDGYYFDPMFPDELWFAGIWRLDDLHERGAWLPHTRIEFEARPYPGWSASGTAFERWPTAAPTRQSRLGRGAEGWYLSTYHRRRGNEATGELVSAPFFLEGDLLVLRVGGGRDPEHLRVELLVDGTVVHTTTGSKSPILARRTWDIRALRGKQARLRVIDAARGLFGHITVDEIRQWKALPHEGVGR